MNIGRKDIFWNYLATFLKIASGALLLPFILNKMPSQMVAIWTVFTTISSFIVLLDFGFNPSFTRNVTYVFSGVKSLKATGYEFLPGHEAEIDYGLLKGLISTMRYFYGRVSLVAAGLLLTLGTWYVSTILKSYTGSHREIYICWILLSVITCYNLYTYYYDSLIQGRGLVKRDKQINIIGQLIYLAVSAILIISGFKIISIIVAQFVSVLVTRQLLNLAFFTPEIKNNLEIAAPKPQQDIIKAIMPNAVKIGLTSLGAIMVTRSSLIIGSLYLSLEQIASYGITMQLIGVIAALGGIYLATFQPKVVHLRVGHKIAEIRSIYNKARLILLATFIVGGTGLVFLGPWVLHFIGSKTSLMPVSLTALAILGSLIETNVSMSGTILLTKNYVPFFKASLISGIFIVAGLLVGFKVLHLGLINIVLVPIIVTVCYQGWKWPWEAHIDTNGK